MGASFLKNRVQENDVLTLVKRRKHMIFPGKKDVILFLFCSVEAKEPAESVAKKFFVVEQGLYYIH